MFQATINPESPRAKAFQEIFGGRTIPVLSPLPTRAQGPDGEAQFYRLDVGKLTTEQRRRLVAHISAKWNISPAAVEASIDDPEHGVPILATDVIVPIDLRMVL